jgi:protein-S-isoprenylcysteine O-methyltransferase Ste14
MVTTGIYRFSRNPMYVGFALVLVGWACFVANLVAMLLVLAFVVYLNRFQIEPEERVLSARFGDEYRTYLRAVRRWL